MLSSQACLTLSFAPPSSAHGIFASPEPDGARQPEDLASVGPKAFHGPKHGLLEQLPCMGPEGSSSLPLLLPSRQSPRGTASVQVDDGEDAESSSAEE